MTWLPATLARQDKRARRAMQVRAAVASGQRLKQAAFAAGVSYRTARRYRAEAR
jgi:FixJ family two-component response regulator